MPDGELKLTAAARPAATLSDYVAIARPEHWVKHVFILPGLVLAWVLRPSEPSELAAAIVFGFLAAAALASANYVLNEWLDAGTDRFHPAKSARPAVARSLWAPAVIAEYLLLAGVGLALAAAVSRLFLYTGVLFLAGAVAYNVRPLRTKDRVYLDVVSESFNNPIRLTLGWTMVSADSLPPSSLLLGYWMGGAFLMGVKRLAEYRAVAAASGLEALARYRRSFGRYTESSLLLSVFLYGLLSAFFVGVFLIKYRVEYLLSLPFIAAWFVAYLRVGLKPGSVAQTPEKLFREKALVVSSILLAASLLLLTWVEVPLLDRLYEPHYIRLPSR